MAGHLSVSVPTAGFNSTRQIVRSAALALSVAIPVAFVAYANHVRHRAGQGWTVKLPGDGAGALLVRDEMVFNGRAGTPPSAAAVLVKGYLRTEACGLRCACGRCVVASCCTMRKAASSPTSSTTPGSRS